MQILKKLVPLYLLLFCNTAALPAVESIERIEREDVANTLNAIKSVFHSKYAPADWKKQHHGWDLEEQIRLAQNSILAAPALTVKDCQQIVRGFFNSLQDHHASVFFYSTERAFLPFSVQSAKGQYYIVKNYTIPLESIEDEDPAIQDTIKTAATFSIGDEILAIDDQPIGLYAEEFRKSEFGDAKEATDKLLAESFLTCRLGTLGHKIPQGAVQLTIRHKDSGDVRTYGLQWIYLPEEIKSHSLPIAKMQFGPSTVSKESITEKLSRKLSKNAYLQKKMVSPVFAQYAAAEKGIERWFAQKQYTQSSSAQEDKINAFPLLGTVIWKTPKDSLFEAYIFLTKERKRIGYIRIPSFNVDESDFDEDTIDPFAFHAKKFGEIMRMFEQLTDGLVIDQQNNPGGVLLYMYGLLSMLTDKPLAVPSQRITLTQEDIWEALIVDSIVEMLENILDEIKSLGDTAEQDINMSLLGYSMSIEDFVKKFRQFSAFQISEWNEGKTLTSPTYPYGIDTIEPNPTARYTKPILVLVNSLDFSCADFFPAILQDNKRALLFGSRTAGAGGFLLSSRFHNLLGIVEFSLTGSISLRPNGNTLENLGVVPDIDYQLTPRDLSEGYKDYIRALEITMSTYFK